MLNKDNSRKWIILVVLLLLIFSFGVVAIRMRHVRVERLKVLSLHLEKGARHLERGNAFLAQTNCFGAAQEFRLALECRPGWDIALHNLDVALAGGRLKLSNSNDTKTNVNSIVELTSPGNHRAEHPNHAQELFAMHKAKARMLFSEAVKTQKTGNHEAALSRYKLAIQEDPVFADAYGNAGSLLLGLNRPQEAKKFLEQYLALVEQYEQAASLRQHRIGRGVFLLGRACIETHDTEGYAEALQRLNEMDLKTYADALKRMQGVGSNNSTGKP